MKSDRSIRIIGGGVAGLVLGIGLRQRDIPVSLADSGSYPRHRVCGEFISGRGLETLQRLQLDELLKQAGGVQATTVSFFLPNGSSFARTLPQPASCVSRHALDAALARYFMAVGGELFLHSPHIETPLAAGSVRATGRRPLPESRGWRWFGLKAHVRKVTLQSSLELHFTANGYIGLCQLADGIVNVCGLFRRGRNESPLPRNMPEKFMAGDAGLLADRFRNAQWDESSFCSVAGLGFNSQVDVLPGECRVGDVMAVIPPFTGNGMSLAFESAELAVEPLARYVRGCMSWDDCTISLAQAQARAFNKRLRWARWLHAGLFQPIIRSVILPLTLKAEWIWQSLFSVTR